MLSASRISCAPDGSAPRTSRPKPAIGCGCCSPNRTGQQWDAPNGWAPLQWIAVAGLERYGAGRLAKTISQRWVATVDAFYRRTGKVIEKYDVEQPGAGGGGEYPLQDGFGWTNGVLRKLLVLYPRLAQ
jgi:alpha,alpha-trehalase